MNFVTHQSEIGRTEIGGNQEDREYVGKSRALGDSSSQLLPHLVPHLPWKNPTCPNRGSNRGGNREIQTRRKEL